jgi:hypothetical protein
VSKLVYWHCGLSIEHSKLSEELFHVENMPVCHCYSIYRYDRNSEVHQNAGYYEPDSQNLCS